MPTVKHKGVEIECDTTAEAIEVARALAQEEAQDAAIPTPAAPTRPSLRERASVRQANRPRAKAKPRRPKPAPPSKPKARDTATALGRALAVLELLVENPAGLKTADLVERLSLSEGRALSGFLGVIGPILEGAAIDPERVFERERLRKGSLWKAGPDASNALSVLERAQNGGGSP